MTQFIRIILIAALSGVFTAGCVWLGWDLVRRFRAEWRAHRILAAARANEKRPRRETPEPGQR